MRELVLPKFNNNDESYILVAWMFEDGDNILPGTTVAEIETSKAVEELELNQPAVLHRLIEPKGSCSFGQTIALLFDSEQERQNYLAERPAVSSPVVAAAGGPVLSRAAQALADQHGINPAHIRSMGKQVVTAADVQMLIDTASTQGAESAGDLLMPLSRRQRVIATTVAASHSTIPSGYAAAKVDLSAVHALRLNQSADATPIGAVELLIKAIAAQSDAFPMVFGSLRDADMVVLPQTIGVGVTVDVGTGLFIPVVGKAAERSAADIAEQLEEYRFKAMRESFREADFHGASVTLSLHNDPGIVIARPIVFPGQTAMVTLCGEELDPVPDSDGGVEWRPRALIGLAYDHRVINGREAVRFLLEIKRLLEAPRSCDALAAR